MKKSFLVGKPSLSFLGKWKENHKSPIIKGKSAKALILSISENNAFATEKFFLGENNPNFRLKGLMVNNRKLFNMSPLAYALTVGSPDAVQALIDSGANCEESTRSLIWSPILGRDKTKSGYYLEPKSKWDLLPIVWLTLRRQVSTEENANETYVQENNIQSLRKMIPVCSLETLSTPDTDGNSLLHYLSKSTDDAVSTAKMCISELLQTGNIPSFKSSLSIKLDLKPSYALYRKLEGEAGLTLL